MSTIAAILPQFSYFTDNFKILPIEKQAQSRGLLTFFTYFTYFTNKKVLHRIHKKYFRNMILPVLSVEWVEFSGVFTDKNYLTDKNTDKKQKKYK